MKLIVMKGRGLVSYHLQKKILEAKEERCRSHQAARPKVKKRRGKVGR